MGQLALQALNVVFACGQGALLRAESRDFLAGLLLPLLSLLLQSVDLVLQTIDLLVVRRVKLGLGRCVLVPELWYSHVHQDSQQQYG
jgi:hypothetical protein